MAPAVFAKIKASIREENDDIKKGGITMILADKITDQRKKEWLVPGRSGKPDRCLPPKCVKVGERAIDTRPRQDP